MTPATETLRQVLEPAVGPIDRFDRQPCPYYSSYAIEELNVVLCQGATLRILFKNLSPQAVFENAVKPEFLYDPLREIEIYRDVLGGLCLGTARCYATVAGAVAGEDRYWLFVEFVDGDLLWQIGERNVWHQAAAWLSQFHRETACLRHAVTPHLLRYDRDYYERWWKRAVASQPALQRIEPVYEKATRHLLDLPLSLIHGEFFASNILVRGDRICPVDWEMAAMGPTLIDLAALAGGKWDDQERQEFLTAYCGGTEPDPGARHTLDCCRLHLAIRYLGWSEDWRPPVQHAHDWRTEAFEIARTIT